MHLKCLAENLNVSAIGLKCQTCLFANNERREQPARDADGSGAEEECFTEFKSYIKTRGLKIFHQNVCGLVRVHDQLKILLQEVQGIDLFGISESHLNPKISNEELKIPGYKFHRLDRKNGPGGGVAVYVKENMSFDRRQDLEVEGIECCWLQINVRNSRSLLVGILYRPPDTSRYLNEDFEQSFDDMLGTAIAEEKETIIMGDINCNYMKDTDHKNIKNIVTGYGFKQQIKEPTRITSETRTLIDIIASTHPGNVKSPVVLGSSFSDHEVVAIIRKINCQRTKPRKIVSRNFSKYCHETFQRDLESVSWDGVLEQDAVNECWKVFKNCFLKVLNQHAPLVERTVKGRDLPWLDNEIKKAIHEREYHHRKAKQTGNEHQWSTYKRKRNAVTFMIRRKKAKYHKTLIQENKSNPKGFWKAIKKCLPDNKACQQRSRSFNIDSTVTKDKKEIANGFNRFFASVAAKLRAALPACAPHLDGIRHKLNPRNERFRLKPVTKGEVSKVLMSLKRSKSPGIDNIPPGTVKDEAKVIIHPLLHIINLSFTTSTIPQEWKLARCVPIFKSGSAKEFDNYRPISVLPVFSKILERIVHNQLYEYLESNKFLSSQQFGFRRNRSTSSAVVYFTDIVRKSMDKGQLTGALFIDLRKAFDTVDHSTLISKLPLYGIENAEQRWIQNYLTQRSQIACYEGELSKEEKITLEFPKAQY